MTYNPNIPIITDKRRTSQFDINENFKSLDALFGINHGKYSDTTGEAGKHLVQSLLNLTDEAIAIPTTSATELSVYVKDDGAGNANLYYREPSNGTEQIISGNIISGASAGSAGEVTLLGGVGLKWGTFSLANGLATVEQTYTTYGLTAYTAHTFVVIGMSLNKSANNFNFSSLLPTKFRFNKTSLGQQTTQWLSIGI